MKKKKILMVDLDGTLITTATGETFPRGIWDMKFRFDVLDRIKDFDFEVIYIITNQGGIEQGFVDGPNWARKIEYICAAIREYTGVPTYFKMCASNDKGNPDRKPNIGMVTNALNQYKRDFEDYDLDEVLMVGDASGLAGQFSDSDKKCAENAGIDYIDVDEFINI